MGSEGEPLEAHRHAADIGARIALGGSIDALAAACAAAIDPECSTAMGRTRLRRSLRPRVTAGSRAGLAAHRALIAATALRVGVRGGRASRALSRALATTSLGLVPAAERDWIAQIETRRRQLASRESGSGPGFEAAPPPAASRGIHAAPHWISLPPLWCLLLMRLIRELAPVTCIELGTGLGISAAYQAAALELNGAGRLETFEVHPDLARHAGDELSALGLAERIEVRGGPIEETLAPAAARSSPIDYCFVDAEHTEAATIGYFEAILPHLGDEAIVVFDDITWGGMTATWQRVRRHPRASIALDLRRLGVIVVSRR